MSEAINGGLGFRATLNIDDFNVPANAMERKIRNVSGVAISETGKMDDSLLSFCKNGANYLKGTLIAGGFTSVIRKTIEVRGQFQQLGIAFETLLGSKEKADQLMSKSVDLAMKTPFQLTEVASGTKQLLAYGFQAKDVTDTLTRLGNIAAGLSLPLNRLTYLYGTTMTQGRLYARDVMQFTGSGIPLLRKLAEMYGKTTDEISAMVTAGKIGFPDVEKVIKSLTNEGGMFYNLMEKQSKSLSGMTSNLGDDWDKEINKIGKDNQKILESGIESAAYVVEHLGGILQTIKAIAIGYGSYKAAIALNSLALRGHTGVALIDNTVSSAKLTLMKANVALTGEAAAQQALMTTAQKTHTSALTAQLTVEEAANLAKKLRIATISSLLTAQQQEYLSNLNITTSSANYEAVATSVMTVDQKQALAKTNLTETSAIYRSALEQEVAAKTRNEAATLESMRTDVKAAAVKLNSAKTEAMNAKASVEASYYEVYRAKNTGNAVAIATAEKRLEAAVDKEAITRKVALGASSDFYAKKKLLETTATKTSTVASETDTVVKTAQAGATSVLTTITRGCTAAMKSLWTSMKTNPLGWILTIVGLVVAAFEMFKTKTEEETTVQGEFQDSIRKTGDELKTYISILENTKEGTNTHKKALKKINEICKTYNQTLLDENSTLEQQKKKYDELTTAIQSSTAEKVKAKYTEIAMKKLEKEETKALDDLKSNAKNATYEGTGYIYSLQGDSRQKETNKSTNINKSSDAIWEMVNSEAIESANKLKDLTGDAYDKAFKKSLQSIIKQVQSATGASDSEMNAFTVRLSDHLTTITDKVKKTKKEIATISKQTDNFILKSKDDGKKEDTFTTGNTFKQLQKKVQETQKAIEKLGSTDNGKIKELEEELKKVNTLIDKKEKGLNTDKSITSRIKELKEERSVINNTSKEYTALTNRIIELQSRIPKTNTSGTSDNEKKTFDEELDYKKEQYTLYQNWVETMGEETANNHFSKLIQNGKSFKEYLSSSIADLTAKKEAGTITNRETNNLISLKIKYDDVTGAKAAIDTFKDSLKNAISDATTLTEKIKAIANAKAKLNSGNSGMSKDDKAEGSSFVSDEESKVNKEAENYILENFKTYQQKRNEIINEYSTLRLQKVVQNNRALLDQLNNGESDALSALNASELKHSKSWKNLFENLDVLTADQIDQLIDTIQTKMDSSDLKLNPVDYKALVNSLKEAKNKEVKLNPFKALGKGFDDYITTTKKLKQAQKNNLSDEEILKLKKGVQDSAQKMVSSIASITESVESVGESISSVVSSFGNDELATKIGSITDAIAGTGQAAGGVGKIMSGDDVVGGLTDVVAGVGKVITSFNAMHDAKNEKRIKELQEDIDDLADSYDNLSDAIERAYSTNKADLIEEQNENLKKTNANIREQIQEEEDKKKTDSDKIKEYQKEIEDNEKQIAENNKYNKIEAIMGTDISTAIDNFAQAYSDAWASGTDAAEKSTSTVKDLIKTGIIEQLKNKLQPEVTAFMKKMSEALEDGVISDSEKNMLDRYKSKLDSMSNDYLSQTGDWLKDDEDTKSTDAATGSVQNITEETGSVVAGRLNAVVINQGDGLSQLKMILVSTQRISDNTEYCRHLEKIDETLQEIKTNGGNSLLSQGIS